jgi:hypothetical protein
MTITITINLTSEEEAALKAIAKKNGISPTELARKAVVDLVTKTDDPEFDRIIQRVLSRNAELYRRLA